LRNRSNEIKATEAEEDNLSQTSHLSVVDKNRTLPTVFDLTVTRLARPTYSRSLRFFNSFGFRLSRAEPGLDLLSSSLGAFGNFDLQDAIFEIGADVISIYGGRQLKRPRKGPVLAFYTAKTSIRWELSFRRELYPLVVDFTLAVAKGEIETVQIAPVHEENGFTLGRERLCCWAGLLERLLLPNSVPSISPQAVLSVSNLTVGFGT